MHAIGINNSFIVGGSDLPMHQVPFPLRPYST